jgi:hypothetical protein
VEEGYQWVVDVDLERFFDRVQHEVLMARVARKVGDRRLLRFIRRYLEAGVMVSGVKQASAEGTPQGSPLSPLLANILLDDLDRELMRRGHRYVRYADDVRVHVKSERAGGRVLAGLTEFLQRRLKLRVNKAKSSVRHAFVTGWCAYFALAETPSTFEAADEWLRRRLRQVRWKEWKRPKARFRNLLALGIPRQKAYEWANSSHRVLAHGGLPSLDTSPSQRLLGGPRPVWVYGVVASAAGCPVNRRMRGPHVRWCGRGWSNPIPYPIPKGRNPALSSRVNDPG